MLTRCHTIVHTKTHNLIKKNKNLQSGRCARNDSDRQRYPNHWPTICGETQETDRQVYRKETIGLIGKEKKCKEERGRESQSSPLNHWNSGFSQNRNFLWLHLNLSVFLTHRAPASASGVSDEHTPDLRVLQRPGTQNGLQCVTLQSCPPTSGQEWKLL